MPVWGGRSRWWIGVGATILVVVLVGVALYAFSEMAARTADIPCRYREEREGTGFETAHGLTPDEFTAGRKLSFVVRQVDVPGTEPSTIVRVSRCGVPQGVDVVVYVATRT
ncbi:MAG: hypothetical protein AB1673_06735 [Actinomycetota bacterium]